MAGILDFLFQDPTNPGGGPLAKALGVTPMSTPPQNLMGYFRPQSGLLGNSILGNALRGALAGFGASTGTTGAGGIGAGFLGAQDAAYQRQRNQLAPILAGQQYQAGQQGLIGGNIGNIFALQKVNRLRQLQGMQPISMADLNANPDLVNDPYALSATGGPVGGAVPGMLSNPAGPAAGGAAYQAATGQPGMQSVQGLGPNPNPQVAAAAPPQTAVATNQLPSNAIVVGNPPPQQGTQTAQAMPSQGQPNWNDPGDPAVQNQLQQDAITMGAPFAQLELDMMKSGLGYVAASEAAKAQAQNANKIITPRANAPVIRYENGVPHVDVAPSIDASGATGIEVYPPNGGQPQHIVTGLPIGTPEQYKDAQDRANQNQTIALGAPDRINTLDRMAQLANGPTKFGPGQEAKAYWTALAAVIPGINPNTTDEVNMEVFKKYASTLGSQYQQMLGGKGTDAQLENSLARIPGPEKLNDAIKELVPYLKSLETAAQGKMAAQAKWMQDKYGGVPTGKGYYDFDQVWNRDYDPRVYQWLQLPTPEAKALYAQQLKQADPKDFKKFQASYQSLVALGAIQ